MALSIDELNAMQDRADWQKSVMRRPQTQQKKKKGFWQDQISTGGGIGGAIAGGLAGAGMGSVVPGVGTVIGGLAGAILGGGAGGATGQYIENGVVGEEDMSKDVLKEGLLNGAFAVGPIRAASVLAKGGMAAAKGTGIREGIEAGATATPIRSFIANKTGGAANDLRRGVANTVKVSDSFTQETNIMDSLTRNGLKGSAAKQYKNIDTTLGNISGDIEGTLGTITSTMPRGSVLNNLNKNATDLLPDDPAYSRELSRSLGRITGGKNLDDPIGPQELFAFKQELGGRLGPAFRKQNMGSPLTVKEEVDMALWKNLDNEITTLAPEVKRMTLDQSNLITARPGLQSSSQKTLGIPLLGLKSQGAERVAQGARDMTGRVVGGAPKVRPFDKLGSPLGPVRTSGRVFAGDNLVNSLIAGGAPDTEQEEVDPSLMGSTGLPGEMSADDMNGLADTPTNPFGVSQAEVAQQMVLALQNGDTKGFGTLKDIYEMIGEYEEANAPSTLGAGKPKTVEGQKAYNNAMSGLQAVSDIESMLQTDNGLTWKSALPGGSISDALLGASKYETALMTAADSMARLRTGAAMTKEETKNFKAMLPKPGDTPETIQYKLNNFRTYFSEVINQPQGGYAPSSLEEAMMGDY